MMQGQVPKIIQDLADQSGGRIEHVGPPLPDGSGYATMSLPLPKDHWLTAETGWYEAPPMPFRMGTAHPQHAEWAKQVQAAARYAIRSATMNGKNNDFDPDAMVQNFVVGMLGYWTPDGTSDDSWANPDPLPPISGGS